MQTQIVLIIKFTSNMQLKMLSLSFIPTEIKHKIHEK